MKKIVILLSVIYFMLIAGVVGYKIIKNDNCYFNYKKTLSKAENNISEKTGNEGSKDNNNSGNTDAKNNQNANENVKVTNNSTDNAGNTASNVNTTTTNAAPADVQLKYASVKFTQQLYQGKYGEDVKKLQEILQVKKYYTGEITGNFDSATKKALKDYQKDNHIYQDGVLGPGTWNTFQP